MDKIKSEFERHGWFQSPGATVLVDGAYGSCGKGALAALVGALFADKINVITTNAGPNSGHVGYLPAEDLPYINEKVAPEVILKPIVTRQLPVAAVVANLINPTHVPQVYLNAGAILDPQIVWDECIKYGLMPTSLMIHPHAAVISDADKATEQAGPVAAVASTGKGVGAALARKIMRDPTAVAQAHQGEFPCALGIRDWDWSRDVVFVETAQGFSLGLNSGFYPYCTSREATVMQAIADARIPAQKVHKVIMAIRTYPIRVGNTESGTSGGCYPDQQETTWEAIGQAPELTTVTKRVRRVFTWSRTQFREAVAANRPDGVCLTFCDYIKESDVFEYGFGVSGFVLDMMTDYTQVMNKLPDFILTSNGPRPEDMSLFE